MCRLMLKLHDIELRFKWISFVNSIFDDCGLSFIWNDQIHIDRISLKTLVKQKINDQFIQSLFSHKHNSSRGEFYSLFKNEFQLESYLL